MKEYGHLLYWPIRLLLEMSVVVALLAGLRKLEKSGSLEFFYFEVPDWIRVHLIFGLLVFWLARWRPWTIWITGALYLFAMFVLILLAGSMLMAFPLGIFALVAIIVVAFLLGKSQHRKPIS